MTIRFGRHPDGHRAGRAPILSLDLEGPRTTGRRMTFLVPLLWSQTKQRVPASSARTRVPQEHLIQTRLSIERGCETGTQMSVCLSSSATAENQAPPTPVHPRDALRCRTLCSSDHFSPPLVFVRNHHAMETGCKNELPPSKRGIRQCCQLQPFSSLVFRMTGRWSDWQFSSGASDSPSTGLPKKDARVGLVWFKAPLQHHRRHL
jgi:hypothetical protein